MERDEPPPMSSEESSEAKKDIFDDDEDDELFKSAIDSKLSGTGPAKSNEDQGQEPIEEESSSGYGTTSDVKHSNTLEDLDDQDVFKSVVEPSSDKFNGHEIKTPAAEEQEISLEDDEKEIPLDDEDGPQYEEEKLTDAHKQPELQLSGTASSAAMPNDYTQPATVISSFETMTVQAANSSLMEEEEIKEAESGDDFVHISVADPFKVGDGMTSYMAYKVVTRTNSNYFKKKEMVVSRRFSDFLGLHDKLAEKYRQNGRIIPPAPDKSVVGMTKVKIANESDQGQDEFVERRRAALERYMNRTAAHPLLKTDPDFREFLEQEAELPKAKDTSAISGRTMMKLISKVGDSLSSMTLKMEETDEWFEEKSRTFEELALHLAKLHYSTESLAEYRRNLAISTGNISRSLAVLSGSEENSALSGAIAQLSTVQEKIEQIHMEQANADFYCLSEMIKDYIGLVGAVKEVFQERIKAWQAKQNITINLTKKREAKVKSELANNIGKTHVLGQEIGDLERQQDMAHENFERISRQIKKEVDMFDLRKANDFKRMLIKYLENMLKSQEKLTAQWERYLPEIKHISI